MAWFSINCARDGAVRVRRALSIQKRNASITILRLHSKLDVGIHLVYVVEQDVHFVLLDNADDILHISLPPRRGEWGIGVPMLTPQNIPCICWLLQVRLGNP